MKLVLATGVKAAKSCVASAGKYNCGRVGVGGGGGGAEWSNRLKSHKNEKFQFLKPSGSEAKKEILSRSRLHGYLRLRRRAPPL